MSIFGFGKKKEEQKQSCCCGGNCTSETMQAAEAEKKESVNPTLENKIQMITKGGTMKKTYSSGILLYPNQRIP